jgi:hypothetical protein
MVQCTGIDEQQCSGIGAAVARARVERRMVRCIVGRALGKRTKNNDQEDSCEAKNGDPSK